ncbi:MAG: hypothetical protein LUE89_06300 [Clostridiales bacterium]|nr:hypothetical protein [Clostridiales bacterium]
MSVNELNLTAQALLDIKNQIAELQAEAEALTDTLKGAMVERGEDTLTGDGWAASWKNVNSSRFDSARFRRENPDLAAQYMKQTTQIRFVIG